MASERFKKIIRWPLFLYLLPVFFVSHGFTESYFLIPVPDSLLLVLKYLAATVLLHTGFYLFFRNNYRASFFLLILLLVFFFFGAIHDTLKSALPGTFFSRYTFVLPFIFFIVVVSLIIIRKRKLFTKQATYLNILFLILILFDIGQLAVKIPKCDRQHQLKSISREFSLCDTCDRPDIYFIVLDEYAGEKTLNDLYSFNNTAFLKQLEERKFQVIKNSISNYNITPISIASMLNINYPKFQGKDLTDISMRPIYNLIDTNILVPFFRFHGYDFINNSTFAINGQPPMAIQPFTKVNTAIIESQTLLSRIQRDFGYLLVKWNIIKRNSRDDYTVLNNNTRILNNIKKEAVRNTKTPRFIFSLLTMPHFPYYYDSKGKPYPPSDIVEGTQWLEDHYLEYLLYTNKVIVDLMDFILQNSRRPPVIILMSDHGFRHYSKKVSEAYDFNNLIANYLPEKYIGKFEDSLSNVSYLRSLLNKLFDQNLAVDKQAKYYIPIPIRRNFKSE